MGNRNKDSRGETESMWSRNEDLNQEILNTQIKQQRLNNLKLKNHAFILDSYFISELKSTTGINIASIL